MRTHKFEQQESPAEARTRSAAAPQHGQKRDETSETLKAKLDEKRTFAPRQAH